MPARWTHSRTHNEAAQKGSMGQDSRRLQVKEEATVGSEARDMIKARFGMASLVW